MSSDYAALVYVAKVAASLCTIVAIDGSFSRRYGAQLAVGRDGTLVGDITDNCLQNEMATQATTAARDGNTKLLRYGKGSPFIDFRLPCGSGLDILIDPNPQMHQLAKCVRILGSAGLQHCRWLLPSLLIGVSCVRDGTFRGSGYLCWERGRVRGAAATSKGYWRRCRIAHGRTAVCAGYGPRQHFSRPIDRSFAPVSRA